MIYLKITKLKIKNSNHILPHPTKNAKVIQKIIMISIFIIPKFQLNNNNKINNHIKSCLLLKETVFE